MPTEMIKQLLEAGVHFGHQTKRWNPKMKKFIFGRKSSIYIIDLEKSAVCIQEAQVFLKDVANKEKNVLFVGTKKQAKDAVKQQAQRCGMFYITERWIGGLLTNFATIRNRIARLKEIKAMEETGSLQSFTKKEISRILKEKARLLQNFEGVEDMVDLPGALFIIDAKKEENAIREAQKLNIPVVALIDTNSDPDVVDYPIPGNDDAIKSIELVTSMIADSIIEVVSPRSKVSGIETKESEQLEEQTPLKAPIADDEVIEIEDEVIEEGGEGIKSKKKAKLKKAKVYKQKEGE